jgi:hypothetical protein
VLSSVSSVHRTLVVVDADGEYRFLTLPPATYDLEAAMDGFRGHRQSLAVALGQAIRNNIEMELGAFTDTIEVTAAQAPPIDVTSTVVGMTVNISEMTARVPVEREATQVALLAAGTLPGDEAFDGRTPGQRLASVGGASVAENTYIVNGLNISNFREMLGSSRVPFAFLEEVQVKTGGWEAEFGRSTGGVVNMVTRSGSNTLHGAASLYYQPEGLQSQEPNTVFTPNQRERRESLEGNLSLGGPIIRDKLHFFVFATYEDAERFDFWLGPANTVLADSLEISQPYWGGKIDWNLSTGHRIEGTFLSDRVDVDKIRWQYDPDDQDLGEALGAGVDERGGDSFILGYSGLLGERVVLSLQAGRNEFARTDRSDGDECPVAADLQTGVPRGPRLRRRRSLPSRRRGLRAEHVGGRYLLLRGSPLRVLAQRNPLPRPPTGDRACARPPSPARRQLRCLLQRRLLPGLVDRVAAAEPQRRPAVGELRQPERAGRDLHRDR